MPEQGQIQGISLQQKQEQQLSARQLQSLHFLIAPAAELRTEITHAVETNPLLEIEEPSGEQDLADTGSSDSERGTSTDGADRDPDEEYADLYENAAADAYDEDVDLFSPVTEDEAAEAKREFMFNSIVSGVSMQENLMEQLSFAGVSGKLRECGEYVIGSIDESGYLRTHPADIATACGCSLEEAEKAVELVQTFEPRGIGARTPEECLILQLNEEDPDTPVLKELIGKYLEDTARNRLPAVAKALNISMDELLRLLDKVRKLDPKPGGRISESHAPCILPEASIVPDGDDFKVVAEEDLPRLRIAENYVKMLDDPATPKDAAGFIREKLGAAQSAIAALDAREKTIVRLAKIIVSTQYDFLKKGKEYLRPLTMQHAADMLGLNNSTVSRAASGKYVRTPQGVFEFRYFFSGGFSDSSGEEVSSRGVKEKIRTLVDSEDPKHPLSDSDIAGELNKSGLKVSRRTIAKYREEINIPASHLRKKF